jgi:hypothetical protein
MHLKQIELTNNLIDEKTVNYIYSVLYPSAENKVNLDIFDILYVLFILILVFKSRKT